MKPNTIQWIKRGFILVLILVGCLCHAQIRISGKVIDSATSKPLADVSVYIANSTIGTKTGIDGGYSISNLAPGNYEVIASSVGYQARQAAVLASSGDNIVNIKLAQKTIDLKEVTINAGDWKRNLAMFKEEFIGTTNAKECTILNPDILNLSFSSKTNRLTANTDDFLEIQNNVLGYKLKFLVKEFWADYSTGKCHYLGSVIFEEMKGKAGEEKTWAKNRLKTYDGSFPHFLVALSNGKLDKEKYTVRQLQRTLNPRWAADSVKWKQTERGPVQKRLSTGATMTTIAIVPPRTIETIDKKNITETKLVKPVQPGIYQLQFPGFLYVIYKGKTVRTDNDDLKRQAEAYDYQISAVSLKSTNRPVIFTDKGQLLTREGIFFEGAWDSRITDLLPFDYVPEAK